MKVSELIKALQGMPQDWTMQFETGDAYFNITEVFQSAFDETVVVACEDYQ